MKNLIIFGGTGMTGIHSVQYALSKGYNVRILARDHITVPESFKDKVDVVIGNVTNYEDVERALQGQQEVVVVLGTRSKLDPETTKDLSDGMKNIAEGMQKLGLKKVSVCLSAFLLFEPEKVPQVMKVITADHQKMFDILKDSDLEWRALMPPHIAANNLTGDFVVEHDKTVTGIRSVAVEQLAAFLVDSLEQDQHLHKKIGMGTIQKQAA